MVPGFGSSRPGPDLAGASDEAKAAGGSRAAGALAGAVTPPPGLGARPAEAVAGLVAATRPPIVVGLLHSQTGPLAISEKSLIDAEILALEEINARGGVAGRPLKWEIADGRSDPVDLRGAGRRLIDERKASVLVGGWTSECRKAMLAVVEEKESLLIFPSNFEGIERSSHIVYFGGSANQVFPPAVRWCVRRPEGQEVLRGRDRGDLVAMRGRDLQGRGPGVGGEVVGGGVPAPRRRATSRRWSGRSGPPGRTWS